MNNRKKHIYRSIGRNLIPTVSVSLVLLILGLIGVLAIAAQSVSVSIRENMGFNLELADNLSQKDVEALIARIEAEPGVASYDYITPKQVLEEEQKYIDDDIVATLGVNPYSPEIDVRMKADYANADSIDEVASRYAAMVDVVADVDVRTEIVNDINKNIRTLSWALVIVAGALLVISIVLINNTIRLMIYSRRMLMHTMKLVGATGAFIRRPILKVNIVDGLVAALLAIAILCGLRAYAVGIEPEIDGAIPWTGMCAVGVALILIGILICGVTSALAVNKYLRSDYDDLF